MQITVYRLVEWDNTVVLRDEPYGDNSVELKPLQITLLFQEANFPTGVSVRLPQPDASYSACTVIRYPQSWHFLQPGADLIISAEDWPGIREQITQILEH